MKESPMDRVHFTKAQLNLLEKTFGNWSTVGKTITHESDIALLNREAGKQDVLDFVRERTV